MKDTSLKGAPIHYIDVVEGKAYKPAPVQRVLPDPDVDVFIWQHGSDKARLARLDERGRHFRVPSFAHTLGSGSYSKLVPVDLVARWDFAVPASDLL